MARYGNCRNLPLGSINHIDFPLKIDGPFFSIIQIKEISKLMWSNLYSFRNGGCSSRKNVITQSWWTNTMKMGPACNIDSKLSFSKNTGGWLYERKIFVKSFNASQTISIIFHPAATSNRNANNVEFITQSSWLFTLVN